MSRLPSNLARYGQAFDRALRRTLRARGARALALDRRLGPCARRVYQTVGGGKRLRPLLVAIGEQLISGRITARTIPAAMSVQLFHAFALVHDDIIDRSPRRRGQPTIEAAVTRATGDAHAGLTAAILGGDLILTVADRFDELAFPPLRRQRARAVFQRMAEETVLGQQLEFDLTRSSAGIDDILRIMTYKSGRYTVQWPLTIGTILAGATDRQVGRLARFAIPLGIAFQLRDDLLGVFGDPRRTGKPIDSDIREGKRTLLVALAEQSASPLERRALQHTLGHRQATRADVARVRSILAHRSRTSVIALSHELLALGLREVAASGFRPAGIRSLTALFRRLFASTG